MNKPYGYKKLHLSLQPVIFLFSFICVSTLYGQLSLSDRATISLLTCDPGDELSTLFGHTAIRVNDPVNGIDKVFNYGTFDNASNGFYWRFLLGTEKYELTVSDYEHFIDSYKSENRSVYEQIIKINQPTTTLIYDSLLQNHLTMSRYYAYDFFRDNCSIRAFRLLTSFAEDPDDQRILIDTSNLTFRSSIRPYISGKQWTSLGVNLALGPFADKKMTIGETTFLPRFLMEVIEKLHLSEARVQVSSGSVHTTVMKAFNWPMSIFWLLTFVMIAEVFWFGTSKKTTDIIDLVTFAFVGLLGILFGFLWLFSNHISLKYNLNILWANPLLLILFWTIPAEKNKITNVLLLIYSLLLFFLMINWRNLPQKYPLEIMPVIAILTVRSVARVFQFKKYDRK